MNSCFITVGTTNHKLLTDIIIKEDVLQTFNSLGIERLIIQNGDYKGPDYTKERLAELQDRYKISIEVFDYEQNISSYIDAAHIVISHAAAGTLLDVHTSSCNQRYAKRIHILVANNSLMDNHQVEFSQQLREEGRYSATNSYVARFAFDSPDDFHEWFTKNNCKGDPELVELVKLKAPPSKEDTLLNMGKTGYGTLIKTVSLQAKQINDEYYSRGFWTKNVILTFSFIVLLVAFTIKLNLNYFRGKKLVKPALDDDSKW